MYSVYIVDDEEFVVKSLIRGTNWAGNGFEVIASSNDGVDAYEEILRLKPDLVFTDIRMPGMTGLELIKNIKEKMAAVNFVIISGYAEFAYAQKALNYGAVGYCLKPFDNDEINNVLKKVKALLDMATHETEDIMYLLEDETEGNQDLIAGYFRKNGLQFEDGIVTAAVLGGKAAALFNVMPSIRIKTGSEKCIYFFSNEQRQNIENQINEAILTNEAAVSAIKGIGLYETIYALTGLKKIIDETITLTYQYFITGCKGPFRKKSDARNIEKIIIDFENAMIRMDVKEIKNILAGFEDFSRRGAMTIKHAVNIFNAYICFSSRISGEESYDEYVYSIDDLCKQFANVHEMMGHIHASIMNLVSRKRSSPGDEVKNEYFKKIVEYVTQNFYKDITIQSLSRDYAMNANYLCQLFRRELGMTFTDYITGMRMNYSKELLEKTELTLEEIAGMSGYTDYFYFIRVFKKMTGSSPGQYRHIKRK